MDLLDAHRKGFPIVIETGGGGARLAAELFETPTGIVFADIGWPRATGHPFHVLTGKVTEASGDDAPWRIGELPVRIAFEGEQLFQDWAAWQAWRASADGKPFDRDAAWAEIEARGILQPAEAA